jgi:hypothetical protein
MEYINNALISTHLFNAIIFNKTYLIITQAVAKEFGSEYFDDDSIMEQFDITFAKYYFNALNNYINNQNCPPSWKILFDSCQNNNLMQWQYMALGVNAHVNNDLALALHEANYGQSYKNDFIKVNDIINKQIPKVVHSFSETNTYINKFKNSLLSIYSPLLRYTIQNWRKNSWLTYTKLLKGQTNIEQIEQDSLKIGLVLKGLSK